jgi:hypothetical protein
MKKLNRKFFFDTTRKFLGKLKQSQVEGIEASFDEWELWLAENKTTPDLKKLAYILATDYHEGDKTFQAIREYGGEAYFVKRYWENQKKAKELGNLSRQDAIDFCGKGKPQLTGRSNFRRMGKILGIDLEKNPDLALDLKVSTKIMFEGMLKGKSFRGDFTGKCLEDYFGDKLDNPIGARRIVNGKDDAQLIAGYYYEFLKGLKYV